MRTWERLTRLNGLVERLCPKHGCGHPDPDSLALLDPDGSQRMHTHGCCGCCKAPTP